jgi:hypothetical protein
MRAFIFIMAIVCGAAAANEVENEDRAVASRAVINTFKKVLVAELQKHMNAGGPTAAIKMCNTRAPAISGSLSEAHNWSIGRTSLKIRNSANAPDDWERGVLERFETQKASAAESDTLEYYEVVENEGKPVYRYMQAIITRPACLTCHGSNLDPRVSQMLSDLYPDDQATGFEAGDIRGAFSISQPLEK